jgi:hypothetical protein
MPVETVAFEIIKNLAALGADARERQASGGMSARRPPADSDGMGSGFAPMAVRHGEPQNDTSARRQISGLSSGHGRRRRAPGFKRCVDGGKSCY